MQITRTISTVEVHTGGEPFRIVTSGLPKLPGHSIVERRAWLLEHADDIRQALMFEPRGHADMYGGYLTPPVPPQQTLASSSCITRDTATTAGMA